MFTTIDQFSQIWTHESELTLKIFKALTDESLDRAINDDHRTLGRIAWHLVLTIPEMMNKTGLDVVGPDEDDPVPGDAAVIVGQYTTVSQGLLDQINRKWTDGSLDDEDNMYGQMWKKSFTLMVLINHQIHHRGQMTVLMRQAGLMVPGIYGPAKEEWGQFGMPSPEI